MALVGLALGLVAIAAPTSVVAAGPATAARSDVSLGPTTLPPSAASGGFGPAAAAIELRIVSVTTPADIDAVSAMISAAGGTVVRTWNTGAAALLAAIDDATAAALAADPRVSSVERDETMTASADQSNAPWGLDRIDQRVLPLDQTYHAPTTGSGVKIYVVDSGLRTTHQQFTGRVATGSFVDFGDGRGIADCNGHGTHVAGTAAGTTSGVAKGATIVPVKVLSCSGNGTLADILSGLSWVAADHQAGQPAVVNMSLGGGASEALDAAVDALIDEGITVVAAAGNDALPTCWFSPARVSRVITVAAAERDDDDADYSNFGSCNDIFAPGSDIESAWSTSDTATKSISGTSMAAPHVAGAAARLLGEHPSLSPAEVWTALADAATTTVMTECCGDPDLLLYVDVFTGSGRPAMTAAPIAAAGYEQVGVQWSAPLDNGGHPVTGYVVESEEPGHGCITSGALSCVITTLTPGLAHRLTVRALNSAGSSRPSVPSSAVLPWGRPTKPVVGSFGDRGKPSMWVEWGVASIGGSPIVSSEVEWSTVANFAPGSGTHLDVPFSGSLETWVHDLPANTLVWFRARVANEYGWSVWSDAASDPTAPWEPVNLTATPTDAGILLTWSEPFYGTSPVTEFWVRWKPPDEYMKLVPRSDLAATSQLVTGITTPGTHRFDIVPLNAVGIGNPSIEVQVTIGLSGAPSLVAAPADRRISLSWTPPSPTGAPVLGYVLQRARGSEPWRTLPALAPSARSYTAKGLSNGVQYHYRLAVRTTLGLGEWATLAATPSAPPAPPRSLRAVKGPGQVTLTWRVPSSDHGAPVVDYVVELSTNGGAWMPVTDDVSTSRIAIVSGLIVGPKYRVRVRAVNVSGLGSPSSTISFVLKV